MLNKFFTLKTDSSFLVADWNLSTLQGLVFALLAATGFAVVYEVITFYIQLRESLLQQRNGKYAFKSFIGTHCLLSVVRMLKLFVGYLLMMCIMSYNIWMLLSATLGGGIGYLCARPIINTCFFRNRYSYSVMANIRTDLLPIRQKASEDYVPFGLYFNTSDPWSSASNRPNSVYEPEVTMYVSVL